MTDRASNFRTPRSRGFFWQGVFILLPVTVLAVIGFVSIRQDKAMAEREAVERARRLADESADAIWTSLSTPGQTGRELAFTVDFSGKLVSPPPALPLPAPHPLPIEELPTNQFQLWTYLNKPGEPAQELIEAGRRFLELNPPPRFDAAARLRLASLLVNANGTETAQQLLAEVSRTASNVVGETGLPVAPLAQLKWLELARAEDPARLSAIETLRSNALAFPTILSPLLLERVAGVAEKGDKGRTDRWLKEWEKHELLRALHRAAFASFQPVTTANQALPHFIWFKTDDAEGLLWRATRVATNARGVSYECRFSTEEPLLAANGTDAGGPSTTWRLRLPTNLVLRVSGLNAPFDPSLVSPDPFPAALLAARNRLPPYLGLTLEIGGRSVISSNHLQELVMQTAGKGSGQAWVSTTPRIPPALLAESRRLEEGREVLRLAIHLVSPAMLYDRQRARSRIFGLLILTATVTGAIGFYSARRAYRRQEQLSEMKSNFVSSVSHELRAPLASVRLMAENLERGKVQEPSKQHDYFRFIVQECRRLGTLIENVLDFARIEQGRKQYDFEPTDVMALARQAIQLMEPIAAEKQVTLKFESTAEPEMTTPAVDASALQQALINLLDNAIKHSPAGADVTVGLATHRPPPTLLLWVEDRGPGIPAAEHARIFHRFYRRGPELRRETPGVGIGLSIVKHIIDAHGGRVRVESEVGRGSRFVLELPAIRRPSPPI